jgi:hypothetical protein
MRLRLAAIAAAFCSVTTALYANAGVEPAPIVESFLSGGPTMMVVLWLSQDARRRRIAAVTDLGFFLMLFWPCVIPWYAFKSRGGAGWKLLLGLLAIILASPLTGLILYWWRANQT